MSVLGLLISGRLFQESRERQKLHPYDSSSSANKEKLQLLRPLQHCRKRETATTRIRPAVQRDGNCNYYIRPLQRAEKNCNFWRLSETMASLIKFRQQKSIHPKGVLRNAVLLNYQPPVIINSSRGEGLWVMPAKARKRKAHFRSQALHWESLALQARRLRSRRFAVSQKP